MSHLSVSLVTVEIWPKRVDEPRELCHNPRKSRCHSTCYDVEPDCLSMQPQGVKSRFRDEFHMSILTNDKGAYTFATLVIRWFIQPAGRYRYYTYACYIYR